MILGFDAGTMFHVPESVQTDLWIALDTAIAAIKKQDDEYKTLLDLAGVPVPQNVRDAVRRHNLNKNLLIRFRDGLSAPERFRS